MEPPEKISNIKIVLIGDSMVGKTSIRKRYMGEGFRGTYSATLGADFSVKKIRDTTVTIWDLAGDPETKILRRQYYLGAQAVIIVFDIANRQSFEHLDDWFNEIKDNLEVRLRVFVLGNKEDLREPGKDMVTQLEAYNYVKAKAEETDASISFLHTSAKTGLNVDVAFDKLLAEILYN